MAITPKTTHTRDGLKRLLAKEKDHPVLRGWLQSYLNRVQELEDTAWLVINSRTLAGEGEQLNAIGRLLVRPRAGLSDADYRLALRARIRILRSHGLPKDLQDVARLSMPAGFTASYSEAYPKTAILEVTGGVSFDVEVMWTNLLATKPGGTRLFLIWDENPNREPWLFADGDDEEDDDDHGDADDDDEVGDGGLLSNVNGS